jgi:hypothetical protein
MSTTTDLQDLSIELADTFIRRMKLYDKVITETDMPLKGIMERQIDAMVAYELVLKERILYLDPEDYS